MILSTSWSHISSSLLLLVLSLSSVNRGPDICDICDPDSCVLLLWKNTCGVPSLAGGTVFAGGSGITVAFHGGVELDLSAWPPVRVADSPMVG